MKLNIQRYTDCNAAQNEMIDQNDLFYWKVRHLKLSTFIVISLQCFKASRIKCLSSWTSTSSIYWWPRGTSSGHMIWHGPINYEADESYIFVRLVSRVGSKAGPRSSLHLDNLLFVIQQCNWPTRNLIETAAMGSRRNWCVAKMKKETNRAWSSSILGK